MIIPITGICLADPPICGFHLSVKDKLFTNELYSL
jgi:hypothetical protein